jgi:mRNA-degrading endonuclease RelE of RelBE toxin-antitoxin system
MSIEKSVLEKLLKLPVEKQKEVLDFVDSLLKKRKRRNGKKLRQDWAGALKDYRDQYTSLELQKKALEWRGD